ncbi:PAS domain-containing protein [Flavobacterium sp. FZUC8N2.13]|uniref:PAS domain-containing protein n=1 Tax=Flavobacterium zubiriense TaxID=3138075 RepID=A0ABV4TG36_9FLAO
MRNYENACARYYSKLKLKSLPPTLWEFRKTYFSDAFLFKKMQSNWSNKKDFLKLSQQDNREIIITDVNFKIVFVSKTISKISGYEPDEIIGKSPSMFQGKATSKATREKIKTAITHLKPFKEVILNYRKNGDSYWCEIEAYPMFDQKGKFQNYIALEKIAS